jgi:hypothetical protein
MTWSKSHRNAGREGRVPSTSALRAYAQGERILGLDHSKNVGAVHFFDSMRQSEADSSHYRARNCRFRVASFVV